MSQSHLQRSDTATRDITLLFTIAALTISALLVFQPAQPHPIWRLALIPPLVLCIITALDLAVVALRTTANRLN